MTSLLEMAGREENFDSQVSSTIRDTDDQMAESTLDQSHTNEENKENHFTESICTDTMVTAADHSHPAGGDNHAAVTEDDQSITENSQLENSHLESLNAEVETAVSTPREGSSEKSEGATEGEGQSKPRSRPSSVGSKRLVSSGEADSRPTSASGVSRSESLKRKEREDKVKATREKLEKEKEKKLQEFLEAQKQAEELRLKQQEIRKKKLEDLKSRDDERQRAAEERRKKREQEEEERKRNFLKKRLERANKASTELQTKKGRYESYGFGSSAPRFEDIILTASPGARSTSQLNLSALRKTTGDESDHDSPRPGSANAGDLSNSPRGLFEDIPIYAARPLSKSMSKSTTNISKPAPSSSKPKRSNSAARQRSAETSGGNTDDMNSTLPHRGKSKTTGPRHRISFSPVTLIHTPTDKSSGHRAVSTDRRSGKTTPTQSSSGERERLSRSSLRPNNTGGAPESRARSTELPDSIKKSVARLSSVKTPVDQLTPERKLKPTSASVTNLSIISKSSQPMKALRKSDMSNRPMSRSSADRKPPTAGGNLSRSLTTGDIHKVGLSRSPTKTSGGSSPRKPLTSNVADRKTTPRSKASASEDSDNSANPIKKSAVRSTSASRATKAASSDSSASESKSRTLDRPSKAQKAAKADAMSKSMYSTSSSSASETDDGLIKARSVGNIHKASTKDSDPKTPTKTSSMTKSRSSEPVKPSVRTPAKSSAPSTPASKSKTSTPAGSTPSSKPGSKAATPGGSRRSSKDSGKLAGGPDTSSPRASGSKSPAVEVDKEPNTETELKQEEQPQAITQEPTEPAVEEGAAASTEPESKPEDRPAAAEPVEETPAVPTSDTSAEVVQPGAPSTDSPITVQEKSSQDKQNQEKAAAAMPPKSAKEAEMDQYKAKLAEKRREAREKAEREAEEERLRVEAERLAEVQRQREEEERQLQFEREQEKLVQEARKAEEERLQKAIEEEEKRKREEHERQEAEKRAKEERAAEQRLEQEKKEKERQERIAREEQEKLERKKKLEMIMKRVKTSSPTPERVTQPAAETSTMSTSMSANSLSSMTTSASSAFKSPLLQGIMSNSVHGSTSGSSSSLTTEKKFSSPLLNNIMAKVNADRSEDNSHSNSASSSNSLQASPEHHTAASKSLPTSRQDQDSTLITDNSLDHSGDKSTSSAISVQHTEQGSKPATVHQTDRNNKLDNGSIDSNGLHSDKQNQNGHNSHLKNTSEQNLENGASDVNGELIHHNGAKSAGGDGKFEEVLNLSNEQHSNSQADQENTPTPLIAFEASSNHTEGGSLSSSVPSQQPSQLDYYANYLHDQKSTSTAPQSAAEQQAWQNLDKLLVDKHDQCLNKLEELGVVEGDMDDESSEGQIWQMIEGRLPYTLDMV